MSLPIVFSPLALENLASLTKFIAEKWGANSSQKFKLSVKKTLKTISLQPYIFKASVIDPDVRKAIISKQTSLIYQIQKDHIELLFFFDNHQDPIIE